MSRWHQALWLPSFLYSACLVRLWCFRIVIESFWKGAWLLLMCLLHQMWINYYYYYIIKYYWEHFMFWNVFKVGSSSMNMHMIVLLQGIYCIYGYTKGHFVIFIKIMKALNWTFLIFKGLGTFTSKRGLFPSLKYLMSMTISKLVFRLYNFHLYGPFFLDSVSPMNMLPHCLLCSAVGRL